MKTFIINVSDNHLRRDRMIKLVHDFLCIKNSEFIHDGDLKDLSENVLESYFKGDMKQVKPATSCAFKHILAYQKLINSADNLALILEDDVILASNFCHKLNEYILEINKNSISNFLISLEDSNLKYVKNSELKSGKFLYKNKHGRMASAYLIDKTFATNILNEIKANKCHQPIDWFHNYCSDTEIINIYWSHPTIASQGSVVGSIPSIIDNSKTGLKRQISYGITKFYKKLINNFR